jgi:hypothetical protein
MLDRIIRAFRLDRTLFRMVADSEEYTNEAVIIAVAVSVIAALGALFGADPLRNFILQLVNNLLFGWVLWALVAYFVGTTFFKGHSAPMEMMRTLAYAGVWRALGLIPCVGWIAALVGGVVAGVIAIRESMEFDNTSAVITAVVGFVLYIIASIVLGFVLTPVSGLLGK